MKKLILALLLIPSLAFSFPTAGDNVKIAAPKGATTGANGVSISLPTDQAIRGYDSDSGLTYQLPLSSAGQAVYVSQYPGSSSYVAPFNGNQTSGTLTAVAGTVSTVFGGVSPSNYFLGISLGKSSGSFSGFSVIFEAQVGSADSWRAVPVQNLDTGAFSSTLTLTDDASYQLAYYSAGYSVQAFRVRCTARTSGTVAVGILGHPSTIPISYGASQLGNWDAGLLPRTTGGLSTYHLVSAGSTNATSIKASAGQVFGWYIKNNNTTTAKKVSFHNTAGTPTAGSSVFFSIDLPPGSAANAFSEIGIPLSTGIAITTTVGGGADSDNTAVSANDLNITIFYK